MGPTLVEMVTPAIVRITLTSLVRRISSGREMPGTVTSPRTVAGCSMPSTADSKGGNASLARVATHHGLAFPSHEALRIRRTLLSGGMTIGVVSRSDAPGRNTGSSETGAVP